jgi:hypothetical protein
MDARKRDSVKVPAEPGVYEARYADSERRLHIGQTNNLCRRIKDGLVKGNIPHSAGERIRSQEDVVRIVIRWAICDRPVVVEKMLHAQHETQFGSLPKHTRH